MRDSTYEVTLRMQYIAQTPLVETPTRFSYTYHSIGQPRPQSNPLRGFCPRGLSTGGLFVRLPQQYICIATYSTYSRCTDIIPPDMSPRTLGLGPHHRYALGLVHFRFRLDILLNTVQDIKVSGVSRTPGEGSCPKVV